jgi:hypothetical protein
MKRFLITVLLAAATIGFNTEVFAEVSIGIGQPGFYGRLDTGGYPQPQVIYRKPKIIRYISNNQPPVYMRVPRGHAKNWRKHCSQYNACDQRVLFVQDNWYSREYVPRYQKQHNDHDKHKNNGRGNRR